MARCDIVLKYVLTHMCVIFEVVGIILLLIGLLGTARYKWIMVGQGSVMVMLGAYGVYGLWKKKIIGLTVFSVLLATLIVLDITIGAVCFSNKKKCPEEHDDIFAIFFGTAALQIITFVCIVVFMKQNNLLNRTSN